MIKIENLSVAFEGTEVVKNVTLELKDGEILGVVGESGSGKSVTALTMMGLVSETAQITSGRILFDDVVLREAGKPLDKALYRKYQGAEMSMVFQEPMTSLNPTLRVGKQVEEMLRLHTDLTGEEIRTRVLETFEAVGLKKVKEVYASYPHQLSGGMRQRVMIAMAVILHPDLIVADEPTTALDVTIQNQIMELLREINEKEQNAMLFITHDLNLARRICHRVAVMKDGCVVEQGRTADIFEHPKREKTRRFIQRLSTLSYRIDSTDFDMESISEELQKYGEKLLIEAERLTKLTLALEEICINNIAAESDNPDILVKVEYSEKLDVLTMIIKYNGNTFDIKEAKSSKVFLSLLEEPTTTYQQKDLVDDKVGFSHQIEMNFKWQEEQK